MKKIISLILTVACLLAVSCSSKAKELTCSVDELFDQISKVNAEGELFAYDSERLIDELMITSDLYSEGYYMIPSQTVGVETIAFFKATNNDSAKAIKAAFDIVVSDTKNYQEKYNPDNYAVACSAVTKIEGLYVYLVMSPKKTAIVKSINDNLK